MRLIGIDFFRVLAILGVITIHTHPYANAVSFSHVVLEVFLNSISRFAVPFFFIVSGYFWANKIDKGTSEITVFKKMGSRLLLIYSIWIIIYIAFLAIFNSLARTHDFSLSLEILSENIGFLLASPSILIFSGSSGHLWFLPALFFALLLSTIFVYLKLEKYMLPASLILYSFALLAGPYSQTVIGIDFDFNTRNGPFFSWVFFVMGWYISRNKKDYNYKYGIILFFIGLMLQLLESYILKQKFLLSMTEHNFLIGTMFLGTGAALIALANPSFSNKWISKIGPYALGIYLIHIIVMKLVGTASHLLHIKIYDFIYPIVILMISFSVVYPMVKTKYLKNIVM